MNAPQNVDSEMLFPIFQSYPLTYPLSRFTPLTLRITVGDLSYW